MSEEQQTKLREDFDKTFGLTVRLDDAYRNMHYSVKSKEIADYWLKIVSDAYLSGVREEQQRIKEILDECGHQQDDDTIWCNMDEVFSAITKRIENK